MKLSQEDQRLFYKLMWGLQFYVSQKLQIETIAASLEEYRGLSLAEKAPVRSALWDNPQLILSYCVENPDGLSLDEVDIVLHWRRFVAGRFYLFRFLKKHTIFISEASRVYGVLGLRDSLEEMFCGRPLPILVEAVLLPFKGKIIYDGVLGIYNIHFGGGIHSDLNEEYMTARQNRRIITTLEPEREKEATPRKQGKDWRSEVDNLVKLTARMKGGPPVQGSAFSLLRASAALAQAAAHDPEDLDALWDLERRVRTNLSRLQTVLSRAER